MKKKGISSQTINITVINVHEINKTKTKTINYNFNLFFMDQFEIENRTCCNNRTYFFLKGTEEDN